jgi:putrescine aminotransferase
MNAPHLKNSDLALDLKFHMHAFSNPVTDKRDGIRFAESAEGVYVTIDGKRYLDGWSGLGCVNVGYGNTEICDAASSAMRTLSYFYAVNGTSNHNAARLAAKLAELTEGDFSQFLFVSTGSDAIESAIKIVWRYWRLKGQPQRRMLITRQHGYHGNTILATSITGIDFFHGQFGLPLSGLSRTVDAPYWHRYGQGRTPAEFAKHAAASLETAILEIGAENVAAFIVEPIQASGGVLIPPDGYFEEIQKICSRHGVLLIADEIVTGFGKTGAMFGYQSFGFKPDMLVCAKGLTSAYFPMSTVGISEEISASMRDLDEDFAHGFTNCGHPVGAAVALANIDVIESRGLVAHVRDVLGPSLAAGLAKFVGLPIVGEVRSRGVMGAVDIVRPGGSLADSEKLAAAVFEAARERGLLLRVAGTSVSTVLPMITTVKQLDEALTIFYSAVEVVGAGLT